jgi:hypothetical protein
MIETDRRRLFTAARTKYGWKELDISRDIPIVLLDNSELAAMVVDNESEMISIS